MDQYSNDDILISQIFAVLCVFFILHYIVCAADRTLFAAESEKKRGYKIFIFGPYGGHGRIVADMLAGNYPGWKVIHMSDYIIPEKQLRKSPKCCGFVDIDGVPKSCNVYTTKSAIDADKMLIDINYYSQEYNVIIEGFLRFDIFMDSYIEGMLDAPKIIINCSQEFLLKRCEECVTYSADKEDPGVAEKQLKKYVWPSWLRLFSNFIEFDGSPVGPLDNPVHYIRKCTEENFTVVTVNSTFIDSKSYSEIKKIFEYICKQDAIRNPGDAYQHPQILDGGPIKGSDTHIVCRDDAPFIMKVLDEGNEE